jgi:hypothetical protein
VRRRRLARSSSSDDSDDGQNYNYDTVMNRLPDEFVESAVVILHHTHTHTLARHDTGIWEYFVDTDLNTPTCESLNLTANDGAIHYCTYKSRGRKLNPLMFPHRVTALHGIEQLTESERNALIEANKQLPVHYSSSCECVTCMAVGSATRTRINAEQRQKWTTESEGIVGMPVLSTNNLKTLKIMNGQRFRLQSVNKLHVVLKDGEDEYKVPLADFKKKGKEEWQLHGWLL